MLSSFSINNGMESSRSNSVENAQLKVLFDVEKTLDSTIDDIVYSQPLTQQEYLNVRDDLLCYQTQLENFLKISMISYPLLDEIQMVKRRVDSLLEQKRSELRGCCFEMHVTKHRILMDEGLLVAGENNRWMQDPRGK